MITGRFGSHFLRPDSTSIPSAPGILKSVMATSNDSVRARSSASRGSLTATTW